MKRKALTTAVAAALFLALGSVGLHAGQHGDKEGQISNIKVYKNHYFTFGGTMLDLDKLNTELKNSGFRGVTDYSATIGGGLTKRYNRLIGGFEINSYLWDTEKSGNNKTMLFGATATFHTGFNILPEGPALLYPMLSLGGGRLHLSTYPDKVAFSSALTSSSQAATITQKVGVLGLGAGFDYAFGKSKERKKAFTLGLRAGYSFDLTKDDDWRLNRSSLTAGPETRLSGPYLRLTVGKTIERKPDWNHKKHKCGGNCKKHSS